MLNIDEMIDNFLSREFRPKKIARYYPSEIGNCLRKIWYSYKFPLETKPNLLRIFALGNILHDFVVKVFQSEKNPHVELLKYEFPLHVDLGDFVISGKVDDLLLIRESGKNILVEVKSCKNIEYVKSPQNHHIMQLQFYMFATGVHDGVLLYVDKTTLLTRMFGFRFDENLSKKIIARFKKLHAYLTEDAIPEPEARQVENLGWMCKYCEYKERCDNDKNI